MNQRTAGVPGDGQRGSVGSPTMVLAVSLVLGLGVAVVGPNLFGRRTCCSNDTAAIATLRNLHHCQAQFREGRWVDLDGDGLGECGTFQELTATSGVRADPRGATRGPALRAAVLSPSLANVSPRGIVTKAGYAFRILLPGPRGTTVSERSPAPLSEPAPRRPAAQPSAPACGAPRPCCGPPVRPRTAEPPGPRETTYTGDVDTDLAEVGYLAVAWPVAAGNSGIRAFLGDGSGTVWWCANADRRFTGTAGSGEVTPLSLPPGWKFGDSLPAAFTGLDGTQWKETN